MKSRTSCSIHKAILNHFEFKTLHHPTRTKYELPHKAPNQQRAPAQLRETLANNGIAMRPEQLDDLVATLGGGRLVLEPVPPVVMRSERYGLWR